jgi:acyl-CoA thioesterase I
MIVRTLTTRRGVLLALATTPLLCGCPDGSYAETAASDQTAEAGTEDALRILALGDSLTAGYGLDDLTLAFPARLEEELRAAGHDVTVQDAGISGDTTAGGRSRLDWSMADNPDAVIVALGGNDGLRAVDPDVTYDNLKAILERLETEGVPVLLTGMLAPPNLGREYGDRFFSAYQRLAKEYDVVFFPFFLEGVAGEAALNQADRIHPNPDGVTRIVENILPFAERLVERARKARTLRDQDGRAADTAS